MLWSDARRQKCKSAAEGESAHIIWQPIGAVGVEGLLADCEALVGFSDHTLRICAQRQSEAGKYSYRAMGTGHVSSLALS
jgi:muramoyltetrapeptide carboxypeptidase LdcA involved in peptidoglycan recycling